MNAMAYPSRPIGILQDPRETESHEVGHMVHTFASSSYSLVPIGSSVSIGDPIYPESLAHAIVGDVPGEIIVEEMPEEPVPHICETCYHMSRRGACPGCFSGEMGNWTPIPPPTIWHDDQNGMREIVDTTIRHYEPNFSIQMWWKRITNQCMHCEYRKMEIMGEGLHFNCGYNEMIQGAPLFFTWDSLCPFYYNEADALRGELAAMKGQAKIRDVLL